MAQTALVCAIAESGDPNEAEELAAGFLRGSPDTGPDFVSLLGLTAMMTVTGFLDPPVRWLDEAMEARAGTRDAGRGPQRHIREMLVHSKERILEIRRGVVADGVDPASPAAVRAYRNRRRPEADAVGAHPGWPAGVGGRLLWWPEAEYGRLVRQLPEVAAVLRSPWRGHTLPRCRRRCELRLASASACSRSWPPMPTGSLSSSSSTMPTRPTRPR